MLITAPANILLTLIGHREALSSDMCAENRWADSMEREGVLCSLFFIPKARGRGCRNLTLTMVLDHQEMSFSLQFRSLELHSPCESK